MNKKSGILSVLATIVVAMFFVATATGNAGYMKENVLFEDDFDGATDVDFDEKWTTEGNESWFSIAYDSMKVSFDTYYLADYENWSYGIHTKEGYDNDTIYGTQDIYLIPLGFQLGTVYVGFIDQYYVNDTNMSQAMAGLCGAYFTDDGRDTEVGFWWVDSTGEYQEEPSDVELFWSHWYTSYIVYDSVNDTATVNVTDNYNSQSDDLDITHIKNLKLDVKTFTYGYREPPPTIFSKGDGIFAPPAHVLEGMYYIDNVKMWTYDWVETVTPPTPTPTPVPNYNQLYGLWIGIIFAMMTVAGLIFYGNLKAILKDRGYTNSAWLAGTPIIVGLIGLGVAGALYFGYLGVVSYAPSWKWW